MLAKCSLRSLNGVVAVPPSKSMMQRACAAALLHNDVTIIHNPGYSNDDNAALQVIQQLGAKVELIGDGVIRITSSGIQPVADKINCGESGLTARLFIPITALAASRITITGKGSLLNRPFTIYKEVLPQLGVQVDSDGKLPFIVQGPLQAKDITLDGSLSSQFISGLLFAYAFSATENVTVTVDGLNSRPYIDMTLSMLQQFGKTIINDNYRQFHIRPSNFRAVGEVSINVEADWSSATALLAGAAINGDVHFKSLSQASQQADKAIIDILAQAGAHIVANRDHLSVSSAGLKAFNYDATHSPDLFPVLAILAACCRGESQIKGLGRLEHKESDRAKTIIAMLSQLQVQYKLDGDTLIVHGADKFPPATIDAHNDHRIAMAAAIAALRAEGEITIQGADSVNKSYPRFYEDLRSLGAVVNFIP
jgi:3-phosphoshikimate 1-carboxyvinyltransferase